MSTINEYYSADNVDDNTKITYFSRYLLIGTVVFHDFKLYVYQGGDGGEFDVFGWTVDEELTELSTKMLFGRKMADEFLLCCVLQGLLQNSCKCL
jgi:hypothetical protein